MINKKIASEFAIGVILIFAFIVGLLFWIQSKKELPSQRATTIQPLSKDATAKEIDPFVSENYIKEPDSVCNYKDETGKFEAGCNQLLITLYAKNEGIDDPAKEDMRFLSDVVDIINQEGGRIVGQIKDLRELQVEIKPEAKLYELKRKLKYSGYVKYINFNITASPSSSSSSFDF